jgi:hypothetical protein
LTENVYRMGTEMAFAYRVSTEVIILYLFCKLVTFLYPFWRIFLVQRIFSDKAHNRHVVFKKGRESML